ncbi:MAG: hypothetical protein DRG78_08675 [Epsilonproteobacteria bacterium]|nr:MAG: hypothetical protein DRG78_08675 [Campylobacterota bacterium]
MRFLFLSLLFIPIFVLGQVNITAPKTFQKGNSVTFSISASGNDVVFPTIDTIDGYVVQQAGTSSQISIINGARSQKLIRNYIFYPTKNTTIPSFDIKVNGNIEKTLEKTLQIQELSKTVSNDFDLSISLNKKDIFVGEEVLLTMTFKYRKDVQLYDLKFIEPNFDNFWSKQLKSNQQPEDNIYVIQKIKYLVFPQKSGDLVISPFNIIAIMPDGNARNSFFGASTKNKHIYSNKLKLNVKPLPSDVHLIGNFKINTKIDKSSIKVGEAVSFQLEISGRGNIDDLEEYSLDIPTATIYDNESKKDFNIQNGKYGGVYTKSYSIVASNNFIIPPITLKYFDKTTKSVKTVSSKAYNIKVNGAIVIKQKLEVKRKKIEDKIESKVITQVIKTSDHQKLIFFIIGFVTSLIFILIYKFIKNRQNKKEDLPLISNIKKSKTSSELLSIITPYINIDKNLDKMIYSVEENNKLELKKIKKEIITILKELKL